MLLSSGSCSSEFQNLRGFVGIPTFVLSQCRCREPGTPICGCPSNGAVLWGCVLEPRVCPNSGTQRKELLGPWLVLENWQTVWGKTTQGSVGSVGCNTGEKRKIVVPSAMELKSVTFPAWDSVSP